MSVSPWPEPELRMIPGEGKKKPSWRDDPDFLDNWYIGALTDKNLSEGKSVRYDNGFLVEVGNLIASKKTPYSNYGEFSRDAGVKWFRQLADRLDDPILIAKAKAMTIYAEDRHRAVIRTLNKDLLRNQKEALDNADSDEEIKRVLDLCVEARANMQGKQLAELDGIITTCKGKLRK